MPPFVVTLLQPTTAACDAPQLADTQPEMQALAAHVKQLEATISRMQVVTLFGCLMLPFTLVSKHFTAATPSCSHQREGAEQAALASQTPQVVTVFLYLMLALTNVTLFHCLSLPSPLHTPQLKQRVHDLEQRLAVVEVGV